MPAVVASEQVVWHHAQVADGVPAHCYLPGVGVIVDFTKNKAVVSGWTPIILLITEPEASGALAAFG